MIIHKKKLLSLYGNDRFLKIWSVRSRVVTGVWSLAGFCICCFHCAVVTYRTTCCLCSTQYTLFYSMSGVSFLTTSLPVELLTKLSRLGDISEHVRDISRKIADLRDDPLPAQLDNSVPDYVKILNANTAVLRRRHWVFVVAGLCFDTAYTMITIWSASRTLRVIIQSNSP